MLVVLKITLNNKIKLRLHSIVIFIKHYGLHLFFPVKKKLTDLVSVDTEETTKRHLLLMQKRW
jgi:hypothetical protein